jgi:hypothetical protein
VVVSDFFSSAATMVCSVIRAVKTHAEKATDRIVDAIMEYPKYQEIVDGWSSAEV